MNDESQPNVSGGQSKVAVVPKVPGPPGRRATSTPAVMSERAARVRKLLMLGISRGEIMVRENLTAPEYRCAMEFMARFPDKNVQAFAQYWAGEQSRLGEIENDVIAARAAGEFRSVAVLQRLAKDVRKDVYEMAMKLGILKRAAEEIVLTERRFEVGFGDEVRLLKPSWPILNAQQSTQ